MAISVDDADDSKQLIARLGITLPLYSDPEGKAAQAWNVWDAETEIALAATFIVAPGGTIIYRYIGADKTDRPKAADLWAAIDQRR